MALSYFFGGGGVLGGAGLAELGIYGIVGRTGCAGCGVEPCLGIIYPPFNIPQLRQVYFNKLGKHLQVYWSIA